MQRFTSLATSSIARRSILSPMAMKPVALGALNMQHSQTRGMLRTTDPIKNWAVPNVQQTVLQLLFDYAAPGVAASKIELDAAIEDLLLVDRQDRFGLQWELCEIFQIYIDTARRHNRDFASGREAAEWIAAVLEEQGRLEDDFSNDSDSSLDEKTRSHGGDKERKHRRSSSSKGKKDKAASKKHKKKRRHGDADEDEDKDRAAKRAVRREDRSVSRDLSRERTAHDAVRREDSARRGSHRDHRDTRGDMRMEYRDAPRAEYPAHHRDHRSDRDPRDYPRDYPRDTRDVRMRDSRDPRDSRDIRDSRDMRDMRDVRDVRDIRDSRDMRDSRDPRDSRPPRDAIRRDSRGFEYASDRRDPRDSSSSSHPPPPRRDSPPREHRSRSRGESTHRRTESTRESTRDVPSNVTDLSKLAAVEIMASSSSSSHHPSNGASPALSAPVTARTNSPEPVTPSVPVPTTASVMASLSVEEKVRQRKERIEKWRLERLSKEQPDMLATDILNGSSTTTASMDVDGTAADGEDGEKRKGWSLEEDDSDEDEQSKLNGTAGAASGTSAATVAPVDTFLQPPLRPLSQKSLDDHASPFSPSSPFGGGAVAAFKRPAASKPSPFGNLKPAITKQNVFGAFGGKSTGGGAGAGFAGASVGFKGNVFDHDEEETVSVALSARGKMLKGVMKMNAEAAAVAPAGDGEAMEGVVSADAVAAEGVDELEAFMVDVNSEVKKLAEEDRKALEGGEADAALTTATGVVAASGEDEEEDAVEKNSDDDDDILGSATKLFAGKRKELAPVDHAVQSYQPFTKDFYVEPPEIAEMTEAEVEIKRAELGGIKIRGVRCPKPIEKWTQMGLPTSVGDVIKKGLKYEKPSSIQAQAIPAVMSGRDVIGIAKTGSGKTIAFLLPMFRHIKDQTPLKTGEGPIALIMTPTRELAVQIHRECKQFTKALNLRAVCCYGGAPVKDQIAELKRGAEIIICTPGRMIDLLCANSGRVTNLKRVTYLVLDEADRMFDMGFEPQVMRIVNNIRPSRQTILFSATFPRKMEALARKILKQPLEITVGGRSTVCSDVHQIVEVRPEDTKFLRTLEILGDCFNTDPDAKVLLFVDRHEAADNLLRDLLKRGYPCQSLHGGKDQADRQSTFQDFKTGDTNIVIATSVAARGLDVKQLKIVINYECPNHMEDYVHRCGRTGRAGNKGTAYTFITPDQDKYAVDIVQALKMSGVEVPADVQALAESFIGKVKAGTANYSSSGFGGKGLDKLDKERDAVKQYQKKAHGANGGAEEGDESDESEREDGGGEEDAFTDEEEDNDVFSFKTTMVRQPGQAGGAAPAAGGMSAADKERLEAMNATAAAAAAAAVEASGGTVDEIAKAKKAIAEANAKLGQEGLNKAKDIIALINRKLGPSGTPLDPAAIAAGKRTAGEAPFAVEIEINDYPQKARWKVTNKEMINQITDISGSAITTRGLYFEKGKAVPAGQRKLYLFIEADTQIQIDRAKKEIKRILKEATLMAMEAEAAMGGGGRYLVTNG
ncbi:pre-mRNA processing RNA-helicase [Podochytrium sp. JEL0797]|nr:pre-mRNA processing RNA-helicase [Podochytrium sp. JEL0797]